MWQREIESHGETSSKGLNKPNRERLGRKIEGSPAIRMNLFIRSEQKRPYKK